jgi:hypothetical protein
MQNRPGLNSPGGFCGQDYYGVEEIVNVCRMM